MTDENTPRTSNYTGASQVIRRTVRQFKRLVPDWDHGAGERHIELVYRETWWLFGFIPLYSRDRIGSSNV